ncbi:HEAT repeat-containing protein 2 [Tetrabaena socialis]|uniref:HEAT repeat-containing protein 2 n=1 Tax=Tetrabaena socialis TaxID=47790 RepID=A0A2J8AC28_9CHLO|nr:HEAT repeat-containing protein 2 [Tetrabaena socialis]|eukprot:PNH10088.1 HEAT repeat-containing protein 2 [Tetrabaena socialis]
MKTAARAAEDGAAHGALLSEVLLPSLVWSAGKTSASVRYAAVTALATALSRRLLAPQHLLEAVEGAGGAGAAAGGGGGLLPLLNSVLDEDWYADMRLAGCYVAQKLLESAGPLLSDASRRALYPELHKRLDDAHNAVRCAACRALAAFVVAAGPAYCDTNSGYLVAGVAIHMDDGDPAVQEAACAVLLAAAATKPAVTAAEVAKVRDRFRSKHYCDRVLAAARAAQEAAQAADGP